MFINAIIVQIQAKKFRKVLCVIMLISNIQIRNLQYHPIRDIYSMLGLQLLVYYIDVLTCEIVSKICLCACFV